jgi:predicted 3-demethylubiquinone-9 3-methyltransferase (glyoxalase superfamily)
MKNEIFPCLWFNSNIKEAANYYRSVFLNSTSKEMNPYVVNLKLEGEKFILLNGAGGPEFTFNPTVSFFVLCETKDEIEQLWQSLTESGKVMMPWTNIHGVKCMDGVQIKIT